ncbi:MAG TPA: site-2 protease family protein [Gemmatimonadaceae bacterium]|nr:site-2 protease family protein [Gemmatimonadaceae bacterium]
MEFNLGTFLMVAPILLFSMTAHEWAHGYAALKQGDPTAYQMGYVTWNPVKYIDPIMTIIVPIISFFWWHFPFGGMRSGPIRSRNFRNFKRGDIIVSLAGVAANFTLIFVFALLFALTGLVGRLAPAIASPLSTLQTMAFWGIQLNTILVGINTLPLPPFDGSVLPRHLLPAAWAAEYQKLQPFGFFIMVFVFTIGTGILYAWMTPFLFIQQIVIAVVTPLALGRGGWAL